MKWEKILFNRKYEIIDEECKCGSDKIKYTIIETIGHKSWDISRHCEMILDKKISKAYCPECGADMIIKESEK